MPRKDHEARRAYHREYMRGWYERNRDRHLGYVAENSKRNRSEVGKYLIEVKAQPCTDCGGTFPPEAMDFDHLGEKKFSVGQHAGYNLKAVQAEIAKCELVCANCHRVRTMARRRGIA